MRFKQIQTSDNQLVIFGVLAILLAVPAFFINLGITPFIEDESIRALVTLEMDISKNYAVPTIGGSYYYNKPPLFNWLVLPFFHYGGYNEWMLRLPVVLSLLLFSFTIFLMVRKHTSTRVAFTAALLFLTCGRIITYESLKGLIDIIFSWVLFANFMILYNGLKHSHKAGTFLLSYFLLFLGFMFKGIPALVFQGITLLVMLFILYQWKMIRVLFSVDHILGVVLFLVLAGGYYFIYFSRNPGSFEEMVSIIFQQSARRTALRFGIGRTIQHFFTYPFEFFGHFAPWTLLMIYFFRKGSKQLLGDPFIKNCLWVFLLNITVYWFSPESFARYVLMLVPMLYIVLVYLFEHSFEWKASRLLYYLFFGVIILGVIVSFSIPFMKQANIRPQVILKSVFLLVSFTIIALFYYRQPRNMLILAALFILVFRIGFDWFVLTHRVERKRDTLRRIEAIKIGNFARTHDVFVYGEPFKSFNEDTSTKYISFFTRFYISAQAHKIIRDSKEIKPGSYYLVRREDVENIPHVDFSHIGVILDKEERFLVQFMPATQLSQTVPRKN